MKYLSRLLILVPIFLLACTPKSENTNSLEPEVSVQSDPVNTLLGADKIETLYVITDEKCRVSWQAISTKKSQDIEVHLRNRTDCERSFSEVSNLHKKVLARLLRDYPPQTIRQLSTGGLNSLQPDGSWNDIVAKAASASKDYQEYRQKYPKHSSQKSINAIFVELVQQTQPHLPFKQMLATLGLNFELYQVEKVFNTNNEKGETLINDASTLWWKPTSSRL